MLHVWRLQGSTSQNVDTFNYLHVNNPKAKECILRIKDQLNVIDPYRELHEFEKTHIHMA